MVSSQSGLVQIFPSKMLFFWRTGRVHSAAVSGIDTDRGIVAVEWFENGETKGKEVSESGL